MEGAYLFKLESTDKRWGPDKDLEEHFQAQPSPRLKKKGTNKATLVSLFPRPICPIDHGHSWQLFQVSDGARRHLKVLISHCWQHCTFSWSFVHTEMKWALPVEIPQEILRKWTMGMLGVIGLILWEKRKPISSQSNASPIRGHQESQIWVLCEVINFSLQSQPHHRI